MAQTVLVVDDDPLTQRVLKHYLERAGYQMIGAHNGREAIKRAKSELPHLIILDVMMPDMDGYSVAKALRGDARTQDSLIVAVTGYGRDGDRDKSARAGIDLHLTKPVDPDALMEALDRGRAAGKAQAS